MHSVININSNHMVDFNFCVAYVLVFMCTLFCNCVVVTISVLYVCIMYSSGKEEQPWLNVRV